jgi:hypothetical protein
MIYARFSLATNKHRLLFTYFNPYISKNSVTGIVPLPFIDWSDGGIQDRFAAQAA